MRADAEDGEEEGKLVEEEKQNMNDYDGIYQAGENAARENSMLFDEFRKVIEA